MLFNDRVARYYSKFVCGAELQYGHPCDPIACLSRTATNTHTPPHTLRAGVEPQKHGARAI